MNKRTLELGLIILIPIAVAAIFASLVYMVNLVHPEYIRVRNGCIEVVEDPVFGEENVVQSDCP
jgi:hypothetical protein